MYPDDSLLVVAARGKLVEYINALWAGSVVASAPLKEVYTQRLAAAAMLLALLETRRDRAGLREFVREENSEFHRDLLVTDEGRAARAAFNHFARAAAAIDELNVSDAQSPTGPQSIVGSRLSGVDLFHDCVKLAFDGRTFTVYCPIVVETPKGQVRTGEGAFRDGIREPIGQIVRVVAVGDDVATIDLAHHRITMQLDQRGGERSEALIFVDQDGRMFVSE